MRQNMFDHIYALVRKIPKGKVTTYGEIADVINGNWKLENRKSRISARLVGFALHANKDSKTPCHRVVDRTGRLAPGFAFEGPREQKRRLEIEGVAFKDEMHVDLEKCLWEGNRD